MTRRSAVTTLVRVAELREAVARGEAGRALALARAADSDRERAEHHLAASGLAGGTRDALRTSTEQRLLRAEAVVQAGAAQDRAERDRDAALAGWIEARRRQRLFESLAARKQEQARTARDHRDQALADDLALRSTGTRRGR